MAASELQDYDNGLNLDNVRHGDEVQIEIGGKVYDVIKIEGGLEFSYAEKSFKVFGLIEEVRRGLEVDLRDWGADIVGAIGSIRGIVAYKMREAEVRASTIPPGEGEHGQLLLDY